VRLKTGDAFLSGRGLEELEALRKANIVFFVVPGVASERGEIRPFISAVSRMPRKAATKS
jgi:precorrin-4 methylase